MIENYKLYDLISHDDEAKCFMAMKEEKKYCMKVIRIKKGNEEMIEKARKEVGILKRLKGNENIISIEDHFELTNSFEHRIFIITEMMDMDLSNYLKLNGGKLSKKTAKLISFQILNALNYCHLNLVSHHDLKLENVIINNEWNKVRIIDFGSATLSGIKKKKIFSKKADIIFFYPFKNRK